MGSLYEPVPCSPRPLRPQRTRSAESHRAVVKYLIPAINSNPHAYSTRPRTPRPQRHQRGAIQPTISRPQARFPFPRTGSCRIGGQRWHLRPLRDGTQPLSRCMGALPQRRRPCSGQVRPRFRRSKPHVQGPLCLSRRHIRHTDRRLHPNLLRRPAPRPVPRRTRCCAREIAR